MAVTFRNLMNPGPPHRLRRWLPGFVRAVAVLAAALGGIVLSGWLLDVPVLRSPIYGAGAMRPDTATAFLLCGAALGLLQRPERSTLGRWLGRALAALLAAWAALTLAGHVLRWELDIDLAAASSCW